LLCGKKIQFDDNEEDERKETNISNLEIDEKIVTSLEVGLGSIRLE
jgi:hypothetical protein